MVSKALRRTLGGFKEAVTDGGWKMWRVHSLFTNYDLVLAPGHNSTRCRKWVYASISEKNAENANIQSKILEKRGGGQGDVEPVMRETPGAVWTHIRHLSNIQHLSELQHVSELISLGSRRLRGSPISRSDTIEHLFNHAPLASYLHGSGEADTNLHL